MNKKTRFSKLDKRTHERGTRTAPHRTQLHARIHASAYVPAQEPKRWCAAILEKHATTHRSGFESVYRCVYQGFLYILACNHLPPFFPVSSGGPLFIFIYYEKPLLAQQRGMPGEHKKRRISFSKTCLIHHEIFSRTSKQHVENECSRTAPFVLACNGALLKDVSKLVHGITSDLNFY